MDALAIVAKHWPYDGPHTREKLHAATETIAELVRYLNNVTLAGRTLEQAADVDQIISDLQTTVERLPQFLNQLVQFLTYRAANHSLLDDRHSDDPATGTFTAGELVGRLLNARDACNLLFDALNRARNVSTHLADR